MLVPERDEHVEFVLRNWDEVTALADVPLPPDPEIVRRLRRKDLLPVAAAEAGVAAPATFFAETEEAVRAARAAAPVPAEAGRRARSTRSVRRQGGRRERRRRGRGGLARRRATRGFEMILQELDSRLPRGRLLALHVRRAERRPARDRRRPQGAPGPAPLRHERRIRGPLRARRPRSRAAPARVRRLPGLRSRRVRARSARRRVQGARGEHAPAGVGGHRDDGHVRRRADRVRRPVRHARACAARRSRATSRGVYLAKDLWVSAQMAQAPRAVRPRTSSPTTCARGRCARCSRRTTRCRRWRAWATSARGSEREDRPRRPARLHDALRPPRSPRRSAQRGHDVHLLTSPFLLDRTPEPERLRPRGGVHPVSSSRLLRHKPRARLRRLVKGAEYLPSVRRLLRRIEAISPDVVHVQWLARPELDVRWLRRIASRYPLVLHRTQRDAAARARVRRVARGAHAGVRRVVVHSGQAVERLVELGIDREKLVRVSAPVFDAPATVQVEPPSGTTLLFFGLIRALQGARRARAGAAGDPAARPGRAARRRRRPARADRAACRTLAASLVGRATRSSGGSASSPTRRSRRSSRARRRSASCRTARSSRRACSRSRSATGARPSCPTSGPSATRCGSSARAGRCRLRIRLRSPTPAWSC